MTTNTNLYNNFFLFFVAALLVATSAHMYFGWQLVPGSMNFIIIFCILISLIIAALLGFLAVCFKFLAIQHSRLATSAPILNNDLQKAIIGFVLSSLFFVFVIPPAYGYFRDSVGTIAEAINGGFYLLYGWIGGYALCYWGLWLYSKIQPSDNTLPSKSPLLYALLISTIGVFGFGLLWSNQFALFGNLPNASFLVLQGVFINMFVQCLAYSLFSIFLWIYTSVPNKK